MSAHTQVAMISSLTAYPCLDAAPKTFEMHVLRPDTVESSEPIDEKVSLPDV
jgi:hypothetical protein